VGNKDRGASKANKKTASASLKQKRQAKKAKKTASAKTSTMAP